MYLLGVLNSRLMTYYHIKKFLDEFKMRFQKVLIKDCKRLPIRDINFSNNNEKQIHDEIVNHVVLMLDLHKQLADTREPRSREQIQRRIDATDKQIDRLVYELYDLTPAEIRIVERNS